MRRRLGLIALLMVLALPISIVAAEFQQGDQCIIGAEQTLGGNLYTLCQTLIVDGTVHGDVVAITGNTTINGTVDGDLTAFGGQVTISGTVGGDIRVLSARLLVAPTAHLTGDHADIAGIGLSAELLAPVTGDVLFLGYQGIVGSTVGGNVRFSGVALAVSGQVGGSADVSVQSAATALRPPDIPSLGLSFVSQGLTLAEGGEPRIKGDLRYEAPEQASLAPGAVGGEIRFTRGASGGQIGIAPFGEVVGDYLGAILRDLLALMVVGLVGLLISPEGLQEAGRRLRSRWQTSLGYGFIAFLMFFPVALLLAALNVAILGLVHVLTLGELTLTSALLLAIIDLVLVGGFWFVVAFLARLVVCYVIGQRIGRRILLTTDRATTAVISLLIGVLIFAAIANLPLGVIGFILNSAMSLVGLGAIVLFMRDRLSNRRRTPLPAHALVSGPLTPSSDDLISPPEDIESLPGMDNLPEGFTWFDG
jgi:Polymer-forming cytoskeletal